MRRSYIKRGSGRKTKANKASNARLKKKFEALGITACELNYPGCTRTEFLSWAHGKKRRHLQGDELDTLVCLACTPCHSQLEQLPESEMCEIVRTVISERELLVA